MLNKQNKTSIGRLIWKLYFLFMHTSTPSFLILYIWWKTSWTVPCIVCTSGVKPCLAWSGNLACVTKRRRRRRRRRRRIQTHSQMTDICLFTKRKLFIKPKHENKMFICKTKLTFLQCTLLKLKCWINLLRVRSVTTLCKVKFNVKKVLN